MTGAGTDWPTVVASGITGALAGGLVSWVAAPHLANRQERGRDRSTARDDINATIQPILTNVRQYQAHARSSLGREPGDNTIHASDISLCATLLKLSGRLGRWRRWMVKRRITRLFGKRTVELCDVHGDDAANPQAVIGILLNRQYNASRRPDRFQQPDTGEFDKALRCPPESPDVERLVKSLVALTQCR